MKPYFLFAITLSSLSWAQSTREPGVENVEKWVKTQLLEPLSAKEQHRPRLSRGALPPQARRVRVSSETVSVDMTGHNFVPFVVDSRAEWTPDTERSWRKAAMEGCVYLQSREVFVKQGQVFLPTGLILGKKGTKVAPKGTCAPKSEEMAQAPEVVRAKR